MEGCGVLTMLEVELNVITTDVGGHGDDRGTVELADQMAGRYTIQVRHDDVHKNQIVFRTTLHLVYSLQTVELDNEQVSDVSDDGNHESSSERRSPNIPQCRLHN